MIIATFDAMRITPTQHTDDIYDPVLAGIAKSLEAGLCWGCQQPTAADHAPNCPELIEVPG